MLVNLVMFLTGVLMVVGAFVIIKTTKRLDISLRVVSMLCIGGWGAELIGRALKGTPMAMEDLLGPIGVALWILQTVMRTCGDQTRRPHPTRRAEDLP